MKSTVMDWLTVICIVAGIGLLAYSAYGVSGNPDTTKWLAKSLSDATMKDVLSAGGILVVAHAILSR